MRGLSLKQRTEFYFQSLPDRNILYLGTEGSPIVDRRLSNLRNLLESKS